MKAHFLPVKVNCEGVHITSMETFNYALNFTEEINLINLWRVTAARHLNIAKSYFVYTTSEKPSPDILSTQNQLNQLQEEVRRITSLLHGKDYPRTLDIEIKACISECVRLGETDNEVLLLTYDFEHLLEVFYNFKRLETEMNFLTVNEDSVFKKT